jgi:hypothetical protein
MPFHPSSGLRWRLAISFAAAVSIIAGDGGLNAQQAGAPPVPPAASGEQASITPLDDDQMQILVARIALYPDELVALITSASLYPLQIVEAARFLDQVKTSTSLKPKQDWDGSVVSLLNYPDVVKMMSTDLDWTQQLGDAVANQQKDMLIAIQTLRDKAVANGIIKDDGKVKVIQQNDNVVIQSADPEKIYVPQYEPRMLYEDGYAAAPIGYYPDSYPNYYYPTAPFFAGFVTGAVFGAVVDWDRWGVWGGRFDGNDIDIDCDHCFNGHNRDGKINFNDVDWKNVDRSKIKFDRNQFANIDKNNIRNRLEAGGNNDIRARAKSIRSNAAHVDRAKVSPSTIKDVRANKVREQGGDARNRVASRAPDTHRGQINARPGGNRDGGQRAMAAKRDHRASRPSGLGEVRPRGAAQLHSQRGGRAMGGGQFAGSRGGGGGGHMAAHRGGGGHARMPHGGRRR